VQERRGKLTEQYGMLRKSLDHTDEQMARLQQEHKAVQEEIAVVAKSLQQVAAETQRVDEQISRHLSDQTTLQRCSQATQDGAEKIRRTIHERELDATQLQNELARIRIDILNTAAHNEQLRTSLQAVLGLLKEREKLIDKYDTEIRRRTDELEKKQAYVDSLNRKYDALTSRQTVRCCCCCCLCG
jgi:chromosome segregation ATPase